MLESNEPVLECQDVLTNRGRENALRIEDARASQRLKPRNGCDSGNKAVASP